MAARRPSADGAALTPNKALSRMAATALNHFEPHVRAIAHLDSGFADGRRDVGVLRTTRNGVLRLPVLLGRCWTLGDGLYPDMMLPGYAGFGSPGAARLEEDNAYAQAETKRHQDDDPHLRSCRAVMGYQVHATDGDIGHVQGFLVDDETWAIRYVVVNTSSWWLGRELNIAREWIKDVRWSDASITVDRTPKAVKDALLDEPSGELDREQRQGFYSGDPRPAYGTEVPKRETEVPRK